MKRQLRFIKDEAFISELLAGKSFNVSYCTTFSAILTLLEMDTTPKYYKCLKIRLCEMGFDTDYSKEFFVLYTSHYVFIVGEDYDAHTRVNNLLFAVKHHIENINEQEKTFVSLKEIHSTNDTTVTKLSQGICTQIESKKSLIKPLNLFSYD